MLEGESLKQFESFYEFFYETFRIEDVVASLNSLKKEEKDALIKLFKAASKLSYSKGRDSGISEGIKLSAEQIKEFRKGIKQIFIKHGMSK